MIFLAATSKSQTHALSAKRLLAVLIKQVQSQRPHTLAIVFGASHFVWTLSRPLTNSHADIILKVHVISIYHVTLVDRFVKKPMLQNLQPDWPDTRSRRSHRSI